MAKPKSIYNDAKYSLDFWDSHRVLMELSFENGAYLATWRESDGYYKTQKFIFYTKKEVLDLLRHKYDVVVSRCFA